MNSSSETYPWFWNELKQVGTDYSDPAKVHDYDAKMKSFRDFAKEVHEIVSALQLQTEHSLLELGTGTGELSLGCAAYCKKVYAVDISDAMLKVAMQKAEERDIRNIEFIKSGFLTYTPPETLDAIFSSAAIHHLPDFWKMVAFKRMHSFLKPGGRLLIRDVVFSDEVEQTLAHIPSWAKVFGKLGGKEMESEALVHIKEEYSTFDWIMQGMLTRIGFSIEKMDYPDPFFAIYLAKK